MKRRDRRLTDREVLAICLLMIAVAAAAGAICGALIGQAVLP